MAKFDKFALYLVIPLVILLSFIGMGHDFRPNKNPILSLVGVITAVIISVYCFRYQFFVWLPKNKTKRYSIKWVVNLLLTILIVPIFALFFCNVAFSSGAGKVITSLIGEPLKSIVVEAEVVKVTSSRTWCNKYLISKTLGVETIGIKFCIDDDAYNHIDTTAELKLVSKQSDYGYLVEKWSVLGL